MRGVAAALGIVFVSAAVVFGGVPVSGHFEFPTVVAEHYIVGDPAFDFLGSNGVLLAFAPDEETAMASTTKVMTLHMLVDLMQFGWFDEDDIATVSAFAASRPGSNMSDVNGVLLEAGEQMTIGDLIRGMMYWSGNNAAYTLAEHAAQQLYGPSADADDFVALMNFHAAVEGHSHSSFNSPAGYDHVDTHTTAREFVRIWSHALGDDYFADVVGFQGTFTGTGTVGSTTKTYMFNWGVNYPGWEGTKNGISTNCNGPNNGCQVESATRIGRRVVLMEMQANRAQTQRAAMLDYGFSKIFHPDHRGTGPLNGPFAAHAVACLPDGRALTARVSSGQSPRITSWGIDVDASQVTRIASSQVRFQIGAPGRAVGVDVDALWMDAGLLITAHTKGGSVWLSAWELAVDGTPSRVGPEVLAGPGSTLSLAPVDDDLFVSTRTTADGRLVVESWTIGLRVREGASPIVLRDAFIFEWPTGTVDASAARGTAIGFGVGGAELRRFIVTASVTGSGTISHQSWDVDETTGVIGLEDVTGASIAGEGPAIVQIPVELGFEFGIPRPAHLATAYRNGAGNLEIQYWSLNTGGELSNAGNTGDTGEPVLGPAIAPLGSSGLVVAGRGAFGYHRLWVWESRLDGGAAVTPYIIAEHTHAPGSAVDLCRTPTDHAEGDYVTAFRNDDGQEQVDAWRVGDRAY